GWRCGGWILKEGAFARSASLSRLLWFLSWRDKKGTLPHFQTCKKYIFLQKQSSFQETLFLAESSFLCYTDRVILIFKGEIS
ncbi:MAG: hypothetical protein U0N82_07570, partial [Oscillospiraceae bacterium]